MLHFGRNVLKEEHGLFLIKIFKNGAIALFIFFVKLCIKRFKVPKDLFYLLCDCTRCTFFDTSTTVYTFWCVDDCYVIDSNTFFWAYVCACTACDTSFCVNCWHKIIYSRRVFKANCFLAKKCHFLEKPNIFLVKPNYFKE